MEMTLQETTEVPEWDASERNQMEELFNQEIDRDDNTDVPASGTAKITDYYVRSSAGNIEQKLEIGVQFLLPDGSLEMYECIHDENIPDAGFEALHSYCGSPDNLYNMKGQKVPVQYDETGDRWEFHVPASKDKLGLIYAVERVGLKSPSRLRTHPIKKTYKHADDRSRSDDPHVQEMKQKQRIVQMMELHDISVHD